MKSIFLFYTYTSMIMFNLPVRNCIHETKRIIVISEILTSFRRHFPSVLTGRELWFPFVIRFVSSNILVFWTHSLGQLGWPRASAVLSQQAKSKWLCKDSIDPDEYTGQTYDSHSWQDKAKQRETPMCCAVGTQFTRYCFMDFLSIVVGSSWLWVTAISGRKTV